MVQSTVDLDYINTSETRNVYVSAVSKDLSTNKLNKITSYAEGTASASAPQLVKINNNSFLLLWARDTKVSCVKLNADGTVNGSIHTFEGSLSDCQPVIKNGRAVWYVYDKNNVTFNSLNLSNLDDIKTVDVKTGHDYETKYASKTDGTVTQTCKSCGYVNKFTVPTSTTVYWRTDISNTSFSSVLSKTQFSVGDSIDFWLYDDTDYTVEFSDRSMVSVNKLENYANDIRRITFKNGGSLIVKIYPTYNPSVAKTYKLTCGCTSHTYGRAVINSRPAHQRAQKQRLAQSAMRQLQKQLQSFPTATQPQLLHLLALLTAIHSTSVLFAVLHTRIAQLRQQVTATEILL